MSHDPVNVSPAQRLRRWHAYLVVWNAHRWLGLALSLVLLVVSVSGALLVAHHELDRALLPATRIATPPADLARAEIAPITQRLLQTEAPAGYRPLRIQFGHDASDSDKYVFVAPDRKTRWSAFVNPYTGATLWSGADLSTPSSWLLALHMHFHAGRWGYLLGGLAGLSLTLLGLTGLYLHRDTLRGVLRHPFRLRLGWRIALGDLHKWVGLTGLYFTLVLGGTGLWFACLIVPSQFAATPATSSAPFDFTRLSAPEAALATTREKFPTAELVRLQFPADAKAPLSIRVLHRDEPVWQKFSRLDFDPVTGALRKTTDGRLAPAKDKLSAILAPLHFGFYGSALTKWLYVFGGLSPALLSLTGFAIWWLRRRNKTNASAEIPRRPAPTGVSGNPLPAR
jgi:uncharacterized iron-regulated membrane protein